MPVKRTGYQSALAQVKRITKGLQDFRVPLTEMHKEYIKSARKNWTDEGSPVKWAKLNPDYKRWKQKVKPGRPILVFTGKLRKSVLGKSRHTIRVIKRKFAEFGTKHPLAGIHQNRPAGKFGVPREVIQFTRDIQAKFTKIMRNYLRRIR